MKNNILAIIVVYNPDEELLRKNIIAFIDNVDALILWNNSPDVFKDDKMKEISDKIISCTKGYNVGISKALNYSWHYAQKHNYEYLLTMDQDSVWINFEGFLRKVLSFYDQNSIFGPEFDLQNNNNFREDDFRITSGMLVPIQILNSVNGYRDDFLVDGIDIDFCCRARSKGYKVYYVSGSTLEHCAGNHTECRFCGIKFYSDGYNPFRIYGIIRNHLIIFKEQKLRKRLKIQIIKRYYLEMPLKILLGERDKRKKIVAYIKGVIDGISYRS